MSPRRIGLIATLVVALCAVIVAPALGVFGFVRQWPIQGGAGSEAGGVAVDRAGSVVYVADPSFGATGRIIAYDPNGTLMRVLDKPSGVDVERPFGLAVDSTGNLHVFEGDRNRVLVLTPTGAPVRTIAPTGENAFDDLTQGIALDPQDNLYVADTRASRIQVYDRNGTFVRKFGLGGGFVTDVAVDAAGNVYAVVIFGTAGCESRVQKHDPSGTLITQWAVTQVQQPAFICAGRPGIAIDPRTGEVLVSSQGGDQPGVRRYTQSGALVGAPLLGNGTPGEVFKAAGLAVDGAGTVFVRDTSGTRILRFGEVPPAPPPLPPAPNLQNTIPKPQTVTAGPTQATIPGEISLRSLKKSKCVKVVVRTKKPARLLATIFSGRRSIRLFGQKEVLFRIAPARKVVCIRVPLRAHTFDVRTSLRFALGYRLGTQPRRPGERIPDPVFKKIRLVP